MTNYFVTQVSLEEFQEALANIVVSKVVSHFSKDSITQPDEQYLTRKEVADMLRISLPTLNTLTKQGYLTSYQVRGKVLYLRHEIQSSLEELSSSKYKRKAQVSISSKSVK